MMPHVIQIEPGVDPISSDENALGMVEDVTISMGGPVTCL